MNSYDIGLLEEVKVGFFGGTFLMTVVLGANFGLLMRYFQCHKYHSPLLNILVSSLVLIATVYALTWQYAIWMWFINTTNLPDKSDLWPYAASPIFSGTLIWGVQMIFIYRIHVLSDRRLRVITVLMMCLSFAQLIFCPCRSMEILGIKPNYLTSIPTAKLYIFPIWLVFVSLSNSFLNLLLFHVLNQLKFRFEVSKNVFTRFLMLAPQTHLVAGLLCQIDLGLFVMKKNAAYMAIDLSLGNLHLLSLLLAMNLTQVGGADRNNRSTSEMRKSRRITVTDLNIDIPMNPLSARLSRTRLSSDWAETFIRGIETSSNREESEPTVRESSSGSASFLGARPNDLKAFCVKR